jgi:YD repeat-containing protein
MKTIDALGRERREEYTSNFDTTAIFDAFNTSTTPSVRLNYDAQTNTLLGTVAQTGGTRGELTTSNAYGESSAFGTSARPAGAAYLRTSEVNEQNQKTGFGYDARGNLERVTRDGTSGSSVQLKYEDTSSPGKLTATLDGNNNRTACAYTARVTCRPSRRRCRWGPPPCATTARRAPTTRWAGSHRSPILRGAGRRSPTTRWTASLASTSPRTAPTPPR